MVSDPDTHHGSCVTHLPWCMSGSITSGFLWSQWRGKRSRYSRCMRNPQFYVYVKVFHPKCRPYQNEVIFCMMKLHVLCGIVPKIQIFLPSRFFSPEWWKWCLVIIFIIWEKTVFHNLNLKMMKINNKVNFLKSYFLITRKKPPNINIPYKYANCM